MKLNDETYQYILQQTINHLLQLQPNIRKLIFPKTRVTMRELRFVLRHLPHADMEYEKAMDIIKEAAKHLNNKNS